MDFWTPALCSTLGDWEMVFFISVYFLLVVDAPVGADAAGAESLDQK